VQEKKEKHVPRNSKKSNEKEKESAIEKETSCAMVPNAQRKKLS